MTVVYPCSIFWGGILSLPFARVMDISFFTLAPSTSVAKKKVISFSQPSLNFPLGIFQNGKNSNPLISLLFLEVNRKSGTCWEMYPCSWSGLVLNHLSRSPSWSMVVPGIACSLISQRAGIHCSIFQFWHEFLVRDLFGFWGACL